MQFGCQRNLDICSGMPDMSDALQGWTSGLVLIKVKTEIKDFETVTEHFEYKTEGMVIPLKYEELILLPEEQRAWKWYQIYCINDPGFKLRDIIIYKGQKFTVMACLDYSANGYTVYNVVEDYVADE